MSIFFTVIVPVLVLCALIIIHEFGHFIVAKWCGVGVMKFSIGFGPVLWKTRFRETTYQLCAIPLGGYVRMVGDIPDSLTGAQASDEAVRAEGEAEATVEIDDESDVSPELVRMLGDRRYWFLQKGLAARSAIVFAGPLFNFLLAIALVWFAHLLYGEVSVSDKATIGRVMEGSPASAGGVKDGDSVLAINGSKVSSWESLAKLIHASGGDDINLRVSRDGRTQQLLVVPQRKEIRTATGEKKDVYLIGIERTRSRTSVGVLDAAWNGMRWTYGATMQTYYGLWGMLSGKVSPEDLAGPLFILDAAGKQAEKGFEDLLYFMAVLSVSLAVLNLLPIPVLDGGHLMFFFFEAVFGSISMRKKEFAQQVGVLLLFSLMIFAVYNDVSRDTKSFDAGIDWDDPEPETPASSDTKVPAKTVEPE